MADTTYIQQNVYVKQNGDEQVVANGGLITVESGGQIDIETGAEISIESGGTIDVESGGGIDVESGGNITMEDGGTFTFFNDTYTNAQLNAAIRNTRVYNFSNASDTDVFDDVLAGDSSPPIIPSEYGVIIFDASTGLSLGSARLPSANTVGQKLRMLILGGGGSYCSTMSVTIECGGAAGGLGVGASVHTQVTNLEVSTITLDASDVSWTSVELQCTEDGIWSVMDTTGTLVTISLV